MLPLLGLKLNRKAEETHLMHLVQLLSDSQEPDEMQTRAKPGRDFPVAMVSAHEDEDVGQWQRF